MKLQESARQQTPDQPRGSPGTWRKGNESVDQLTIGTV
jgi:hypothetical protein